MGFKKKVLGTFAAAALTLSMFGGVAANDVPGEVILDKGACGITATSGKADFGTWAWNGTEYVSSGQQTFVFLAVKTPWSTGGDSKCNLTVGTDGLQHQTTRSMKLPQGLFKSAVGQSDGNGGWSGSWRSNLPSNHDIHNGDVRVQIMLDAVPTNYMPGEYTGTFDFTINDGQ